MTDDQYRRIEKIIGSDESPVGIDARKTHVLILSKLEDIEERLVRLELATNAARAGANPQQRVGE